MNSVGNTQCSSSMNSSLSCGHQEEDGLQSEELAKNHDHRINNLEEHDEVESLFQKIFLCRIDGSLTDDDEDDELSKTFQHQHFNDDDRLIQLQNKDHSEDQDHLEDEMFEDDQISLVISTPIVPEKNYEGKTFKKQDEKLVKSEEKLVAEKTIKGIDEEKRRRRKLERQNYLLLHRRGQNNSHQDEDDEDDNSQSTTTTMTTINNIHNYPLLGHQDEVEASKRYLEINQKPLFRWSMDMIPNEHLNFSKGHHDEDNEDQDQEYEEGNGQALTDENQLDHSIKKRRALFQQRMLALQQTESMEKDKAEKNEEETFDYAEEQPSTIPITVSHGTTINDSCCSSSARRRARRNVLQVSNHLNRQANGEQPPSGCRPMLINDQSWIVERMRHLAKAYSDRGAFVKKVFEELNAKNIQRQKEAEDEEEDSDDEGGQVSSAAQADPEAQKERKHRLEHQQFESMFHDEWRNDTVQKDPEEKLDWRMRLHNISITVYEPQSYSYILWLLLVSFTFLYNAIIIPYRLVFPDTSEQNQNFIWMDILADLVYLADMFWFKPRLQFLRNGHWISQVKETHLNYFYSNLFWLDLFSQMPFDWLILSLPIYLTNSGDTIPLMIRLNRILKIGDFWQFFERIDKMTNSPYLFRIIHTLMYELYIIHLGACLYYRVSKWIGFSRTPWTYDNKGNAYLRCFYFAFRTTTSIGGRLPKPTTEFERIYMMTAWLLGVFVFAMVIGQIRDIVAHASRNQNYYIDALNKIAAHMNRLNVPRKLQKRVRFWYKFTWDLQKTFNEMEVIRMLPLKMRTDLMLSIHSKTLSRVDLFKNINRSVLRDLILKLQPILFLPGDYVCRKGDVGHEMYIVNKGTIQVVDSESRRVLAQLGEGSVFGEIAILNLHGQTKRTADVRSCGYSQLFALKKQDLWETLRYYPEYESILKRKVQRILQRKKRQQAAKQGDLETKTSNDVNIDDQQQKDNFIGQGLLTEDDITEDLTTDPTTNTLVQVESIVKPRPRTPKLFHAVMEIITQNQNPHFNHRRTYSLRTPSPEATQSKQMAKIKQKSLDHSDTFYVNNP